MIGETLIGTLANIHCDECEQIIAAQIDPEETLQNLRTGTIFYIEIWKHIKDSFGNAWNLQHDWRSLKTLTMSKIVLKQKWWFRFVKIVSLKKLDKIGLWTKIFILFIFKKDKQIGFFRDFLWACFSASSSSEPSSPSKRRLSNERKKNWIFFRKMQ